MIFRLSFLCFFFCSSRRRHTSGSLVTGVRRVLFRSHSALAAFPEWKGAKLLCAQAQNMYWFLVMRSDLKPKRGYLGIVKGRSIGAAPWVEMGLRRLLVEAGIALEKDGVKIAPVPGAVGAGVNFGVTAAQAREGRPKDKRGQA